MNAVAGVIRAVRGALGRSALGRRVDARLNRDTSAELPAEFNDAPARPVDPRADQPPDRVRFRLVAPAQRAGGGDGGWAVVLRWTVILAMPPEPVPNSPRLTRDGRPSWNRSAAMLWK
jgi:hypothetical protein